MDIFTLLTWIDKFTKTLHGTIFFFLISMLFSRLYHYVLSAADAFPPVSIALYGMLSTTLWAITAILLLFYLLRTFLIKRFHIDG